MTTLVPIKSTGLKFEDWLKLVDARLQRRIGLTHSDLPDWTWYDAWSDDYSPGDAVTAYGEEYEDDFGAALL